MGKEGRKNCILILIQLIKNIQFLLPVKSFFSPGLAVLLSGLQSLLPTAGQKCQMHRGEGWASTASAAAPAHLTGSAIKSRWEQSVLGSFSIFLIPQCC